MPHGLPGREALQQEQKGLTMAADNVCFSLGLSAVALFSLLVEIYYKVFVWPPGAKVVLSYVAKTD